MGAGEVRFEVEVGIALTRQLRATEEDPANPRFIRTVRGVGYLFRSQH